MREREHSVDQIAGGSTEQNEFRALGGTRDHVWGRGSTGYHIWGRGSTGNQKLSEEYGGRGVEEKPVMG